MERCGLVQVPHLIPAPNGLTGLKPGKASRGLGMRFLQRRDARRNVKGKKTKQNKKPARAMGVCASVCSHPTLLRTSRWFSPKFHDRFLLQGFENKREPVPLGINEPPWFAGTDTCEMQPYLYLKHCGSKKKGTKQIKEKILIHGWSDLMLPPFLEDLEYLWHYPRCHRNRH